MVFHQVDVAYDRQTGEDNSGKKTFLKINKKWQ